MTIDQITNLVVTVTLIEMMITIGMGVNISDLLVVARNWRISVAAHGGRRTAVHRCGQDCDDAAGHSTAAVMLGPLRSALPAGMGGACAQTSKSRQQTVGT